ncbi:hypothetical protein EMIT0194P_170049 [Pseudomonas serbica]
MFKAAIAGKPAPTELPIISHLFV